MPEINQESSFHSEIGRKYIGQLASKVSWHVRKKMYACFEKNFNNCRNVVDVGVTSESVAPEANFFEELFPVKSKITAVGVEDADYLEKKYKGLKFVKVKEGEKLPFQGGEFEVSFSNAVIEHIVNEHDRKEFVSELLRVSNAVFLTTPNKYFPIELHTGVPLLHFCFPKLFNYLIDKKIISKFYNSSNLRLLSYRDLDKLANQFNRPYQIRPVYLFGLISNWILIIR